MDINSLGQLNYLDISEVGITDGLMGYWKLNGDLLDYSGNEEHGTNHGATIINGYKSCAYTIANNQYIDTGITDMTGFINTYNGFTISAIMYGTSSAYSTAEGIVFGGNGFNWGICYGTGNFHVNMWGDDGTKTLYQAATIDTVNANQWYHVTAYFNKTTNKLGIYLNGVFQRESALTKPFWISSNILRFGSGVANYHWVAAGVCNAKLFNRVLSAEEVAIEYKATLGAIPMQISNNGTLYLSGEIKEV